VDYNEVSVDHAGLEDGSEFEGLSLEGGEVGAGGEVQAGDGVDLAG
jgi:hypothetical protein